MKGQEAWVIQLIEGIMPRWANKDLLPTTNKKEAVIYDDEDEAISNFVRLGNTGLSWPFAEIKKIIRRN